MSIYQTPDGAKAFDPRYPLGTPKNREPQGKSTQPEPTWKPLAGRPDYETDGKSIRPKGFMVVSPAVANLQKHLADMARSRVAYAAGSRPNFSTHHESES